MLYDYLHEKQIENTAAVEAKQAMLNHKNGAVKKGRKLLADLQPLFYPGEKGEEEAKKAKEAPFPNCKSKGRSGCFQFIH